MEAGMGFTFQTTLENHAVEVHGYWEDYDSDEITGSRGKYFVPEELSLLRLDKNNKWQSRLLPIDWREHPKLEEQIAQEAEDVYRDMMFWGGYDG